METEDRKLLTLVQKEFPLVPRPYALLGESLGLSEEEVLARLVRLTREGILRQIGAIFNPGALGYRTTLVAFAVPEAFREEAARIINQHPGVSHNYLRDHRFNFWFTLAVPPGKDLEEEVKDLARRSSAEDYLLLPIKRVFRIAVIFDLEEGQTGDGNFSYSGTIQNPDPRTVKLVRATQEPLPLIPRPFREVAHRAEVSEEELLAWIEEMLRRGVMRRFAGLVRHHRAGFRENVMVAWRIPETRVEEIGRALAREPGITHCYERVSYPRWPYNLYTMIHAPRRVEDRLREISRRYALSDFLALRTLREYKKIRLKLFLEGNGENSAGSAPPREDRPN